MRFIELTDVNGRKVFINMALVVRVWRIDVTMWLSFVNNTSFAVEEYPSQILEAMR